ncbi:hypothetical protein Tco_0028858 [Tanacetum coccineum]
MDGDDLEELDLRWQVAMLIVRVKKSIQRTGRNLDFKEKRSVSLDKSKIECYNSHRKCHFARECRSGRNQGRRSYGDNGRSNAPTNESSSQALVAQDGLGGYVICTDNVNITRKWSKTRQNRARDGKECKRYERVYKSQGFDSKKGQKSTPVNPWSTKVNSLNDKTQKFPKQPLIVKHI